MSRQKSITQLAIEKSIFRPTKRSRNKAKPIPTESQVNTFDYVNRLLRAKWNRMRKAR